MSRFRLYPYGSVQFVEARVKEPIAFAHVTDLHLPPVPTDAAYQPAIQWWDQAFNHPAQILPGLLTEIRASGVDFVFFGGDNIDCYQPQTAEHIATLARDYGLKAYFQCGNHDAESMPIRYVTHAYDAAVREATMPKLCRHWNMPAPYYAFELKGCRFVVLDPPYMKYRDSLSGIFDDAQTEWFLAQLEFDGPIVLFHHYPFVCPSLEYRLRAVWDGKLAGVADDANGRRVMRAIESSPNILGTFTGHAHFRSEDRIGETCQFMTAPASDRQWRYVKIGHDIPPKSLRVAGKPEVKV